MQNRLELAIDLARRAGGLLLEGESAVKRVSYKGVNDLVTDYDLKSERLLVEGIQAAFPQDAILAEEGTDIGSSAAEFHWVMDPLDGTTNYAHGLPFYCVSIAVMREDRPLMGVIYDPMRDELFQAVEGQGAWLGDRKLQVSEAETLDDSLLVTGFPYDIRTNPNNNLNHYRTLALASLGVRRLGSAALDLAYVAAGRLDGYWELRLNAWDWAAGVLVTREAGGVVTTFEGYEKVLGGDETLVATNGHIHDELLSALNTN